MQLHEIKPKHLSKKKYRKGRGKRRGMYSGRGIKGQGARAGVKLQPIIRRIVKRYHKKRGYRYSTHRVKPEIVNVGRLQDVFQKGEVVSPESLVEKGVIRRKSGKLPKVKILGKGEIDKGLTLKEVTVSEGALEKIKKAGGDVQVG